MENYIEQSKELNIKDTILLIRKYSNELIKSWKLVLLVTLPFLFYMLYKAYKQPVTYKSTLTFMVNEDEGGLGAGSVASGILGSLGIGATEYNLDKILQLSKSFRIISESLFIKETIDGVDDLLANHFIRIQFNNIPQDRDFRFTHSDISKFNAKELNMLKRLYHSLSGSDDGAPGILNNSYEKLSGIMKMTLVTQSEELSIKFIRVIFERLGDFYVKKSIEKQKFTYEVILDKADSLKNLLKNKEISRANFDDRNRGLISETSKVPAIRLSRDLGMLNIMYNEAIKNAEVADFAIKSRVPFVQSIDIPLPPLKPIKPSFVKNITIGLSIGIIISIILVVIRKIIRDAIEP